MDGQREFTKQLKTKSRMYENGKYLKLLTLCTEIHLPVFHYSQSITQYLEATDSKQVPAIVRSATPPDSNLGRDRLPAFLYSGAYIDPCHGIPFHIHTLFFFTISWAATITCLAPFCLPGDAIVPKAPCYRASLGPFAGIGKPGQGSKRLERNKPLVTSPEESLSRPRILDSSAMAAQSCGEPSDAIRQRQDDMNSQQTAGRDKDMNSQQTLKRIVSLLLPPFCSF